MTDQADLFLQAHTEFDRRVGAISEDQWGDPTPCTDWDVRALVHHLVYEMVWMPPLFDGNTVPEIGDRFEGELLGDDPRGAWSASGAAAVQSVTKKGAMADTIHLSSADVPGAEYTRQVTMDLIIHSWDLARGIGADDTIDAALVEFCLAEVRKDKDALQASGAFGQPVTVAAGADPQTEMLAIVGRAR